MENTGQSVSSWSAVDLPLADRFDQYAETMAKAMTPLRVVQCPTDAFELDMRWADLAGNTVFNVHGCPHASVRSVLDIERSEERFFHLLVNRVGEMHFDNVNRFVTRADDALFYDSRTRMTLDTPATFEIVNLRLTEDFVGKWVSDPDVLLGSRIDSKAGWGAALCAFAGQLTPEFVVRPPFSQELIVDQLGALLALAASHFDGAAHYAAAPGLRPRIHDCIRMRCSEVRLVASDVATALNISPRSLHRALAAHGETFAAVLMAARIAVARRMLISRLYDKLNAGEIGKRSGFADASHFARVFKKHIGLSPTELRAASRK